MLNYSFPKQQILDPSKLKEFVADHFKFDENGRKFSKQVENTVGEKEKLLIMSNFSFSHSVFKRLILQTCKNQGLFGKGLHKKLSADESHVTDSILLQWYNQTTSVH